MPPPEPASQRTSANQHLSPAALPAAQSGGTPGRLNASKVQGPSGKTDLDRKLDADKAARNAAARDGTAQKSQDGVVHDSVGSALTTDERREVIDLFRHRVGEASTNFKIAATQVKFERFLEREEDVSPMLGFMLDFAGGFIGLRLGMALGNLKANGLKALTDIEGSWGYDPQNSLLKAVRAITDDHLKAGVGAFMRGVGIQASVQTKKAINSQLSFKKVAAAELLDQVVREVAHRYAAMRERWPAELSDGALIAAFHSFALFNHEIDVYKEQLNEKIERYMASGVLHINRPDKEFVRQDDGYGGHSKGTYLAWATFMSGYPAQLMYYAFGKNKYDTDADGNGTSDGTGPAVGRGEGTPGIHATAKYGTPLSNDGPASDAEFVPEEFREIALRKHRQVWGAEPRHNEAGSFIDDRTWYHEPARVAAAWARFHSQQEKDTAKLRENGLLPK